MREAEGNWRDFLSGYISEDEIFDIITAFGFVIKRFLVQRNSYHPFN